MMRLIEYLLRTEFYALSYEVDLKALSNHLIWSYYIKLCDQVIWLDLIWLDQSIDQTIKWDWFVWSAPACVFDRLNGVQTEIFWRIWIDGFCDCNFITGSCTNYESVNVHFSPQKARQNETKRREFFSTFSNCVKLLLEQYNNISAPNYCNLLLYFQQCQCRIARICRFWSVGKNRCFNTMRVLWRLILIG